MNELDGLLSEFIAETREGLERVQEILVEWERDPAGATDSVDEVFRFVHTVKGSCGFLDLPRIAALAHEAETVLGEIRDGQVRLDSAMAGALLAVIDRIGALTDVLAGAPDSVPDDDDAVIGALSDPVALVQTETLSRSDAMAASRQSALRTVRLSVERLEQLMAQVSDLVLARNELGRELRDVEIDRFGRLAFDRLSFAIAGLRESVASTRLQPIDRLFATLPHMVRGTAIACGKDVRLIIEGSDVEIDREMVESIRDPLTHIIRNAIDHGIETAEERRTAGKAEQGTLRVIAQQSGNQVSITVADDGRGIDVQKLLQRAMSAGLIEAQSTTISSETALDLIFTPGLSTAASVTDISGRGVGMDVVRANVEKIGGSIALDNRPGQGLAITLRAPLTLSIINALVVEVDEHLFGIPRAAVEEIVSIGSSSVRFEAVAGGYVAILRGQMLPVTDLRRQLKLKEADPRQLVIIATADGYRYAAAIDRVLDNEELVVRPTVPQIGSLDIYAGQSLSDAGLPLLIVDPSGLARDAGIENRRGEVVSEVATAVETKGRVLLFEGFDGKARAIRSLHVQRLDEIVADQIATIAGRHMACIDGVPVGAVTDGPIPERGVVSGIRLLDAKGAAVIYLAANITELLPLESFTELEDEAIEGIIMVNEKPVEVLHWPPRFQSKASATERKAA